MVLKAIALLIWAAVLIFTGLVLLGAYSTDENQLLPAEHPTPPLQSVGTECPDLRPLLANLIARTNQSLPEFEE